MMLSRLLLLLLSLAAIGVFSCEKAPVEKRENAIARVGNEYLTVAQAKKDIPSYMYNRDSVSALKQYRRQWIQRKLVLKEAQKLDLEQQEAVREEIQRAREEILGEALRAHFMLSKVDTAVTEEEAKSYYESNKEHFELSEQYVQYHHLKTEEIEDARTARRALQQGIPWRDVADSYAMEPADALRDAEKFYPLSTALDHIDIMHRYLQTMEINEISPIQRVSGVYHFVQLTDRREQSDSADLEWVIDKVKNWMILDKRKRKFNSYLKNLYLQAELDNETEVYNVLQTNLNAKNTNADSLQSNTRHE
ncbi:MAG TPA: peptidyl-prolyl cis-trans isomerase [Fodinibius sp.]|nr:peptidyl-prolyl cis-trans isomerase [Fodinibius sp.]